MNVLINAEPDSVFINWLSRISLSIWTCGASSEPYAAVAMRQPPPSSDVSVEVSIILSPCESILKESIDSLYLVSSFSKFFSKLLYANVYNFCS